MGLKLKNVVPWGRSMAEYLRMFHLSDRLASPTDNRDLKLKILDCAGGPASFNAQMTFLGYQVISCDPVYQFSASEIAQRIQETYQIIINGITENQDKYVWQSIKSPANLGEIRMAAMNEFLKDFPLGFQEERYLNHSLPLLPFDAKQFDIALCSHFLFTYSDHFSAAFHVDAILEMCRVAKEVRIFPLVNISGEPSLLLSPVMSELQKRGITVEIREVDYEFQRGGNRMMQVY